jgi:hypothetical protein
MSQPGIETQRRMSNFRKPLESHEDAADDGLKALLAPGITWENMQNKLNLPRAQFLRIIAEFIKQPNYQWLRGNVGGGKQLIDEYRPAIMARAEFYQNLAMYARVPHEYVPYQDSENSGAPVKLDLPNAEEGVELLAIDLGKIVKNGRVDYSSFSFYFPCFHSAA